MSLRVPTLTLLSLLLAACASPVEPGSAAHSGAPAIEPLPALTAPAATEPAIQTEPVPTARAQDDLNPEQPAIDFQSPEAHADLWARLRAGLKMPDIDGERVDRWQAWYAKRPDYIARMTERGSRYLFHIVQEVEKRNLPMELALLPFIESAFNPESQSHAKAVGMWQFMSATGKDFSLKQNLFRDDRRNVLESTRAALDYLAQLGKRYDGDWQLALAAYNWGLGNVDRQVKRQDAAGLERSYARMKMPNETADYLPKLQAVKNLVLNPERFGVALPALANHPYFLSVSIERDIDVDLAARLAGLSEETFRQFNPQMNKPVVLAAATPQLLLPYDNAALFVAALGEHQGAMASWTAVQLPKTMKPAEAAKWAGMAESDLREINRIPARMNIKAGSTLVVPRTAKRDHDVSEHLAETAALSLAPDAPARRQAKTMVKKGETLASVAKRLRVSTAQLANWNQLSLTSSLKTGSSLSYYEAAPVRSTRVAAASTKKKVASSGRPRAATKRAKTG